MDHFLKLPRFSFTKAAIEWAPNDPGVYALFQSGDLIYIGKTASGMSIKTCLLSHQEGGRGPCTAKATTYTWEIDLRPSAREAELLARFFQANGCGPRCQGKAA